jgi:hypothetical protein
MPAKLTIDKKEVTMWSYNYTDELYHYGVPGMKWGHRKAVTPGESFRTRRLKKAVARQEEVVKSWKDASPITDKKGKTLYSAKEVKEMSEATVNRLNKLNHKLLVSQKADQINAGASVVGKIYNKVTGAHKMQAEIELDMEKRAKVNKAWRD